METQATPRPWELKKFPQSYQVASLALTPQGGTDIHDLFEANAALIVYCCNNFDTLVSLLREIKERVGLTDDEDRRLAEILEQGQ